MSGMRALFSKSKNTLERGGVEPPRPAREECPHCRHQDSPENFERAQRTCPRCGHHLRIGGRTRLSYLADEGSFTELFDDIIGADPLEFPGYPDKLARARQQSGEREAVLCGTARIHQAACAVFVMEPGFMMGSMGYAVGERIACLFEYAHRHELPVIGFTASGGARMQEGIVSLMQMASVSAAVRRHSDAGLFYITVLPAPTTGGVTASFAMLGDIILSEPRATVGFAGRRVIEQTMRQALPEEFQTAESMLAHGFIDRIVPRLAQRELLARLLFMHGAERSSSPDAGDRQQEGVS